MHGSCFWFLGDVSIPPRICIRGILIGVQGFRVEGPYEGGGGGGFCGATAEKGPFRPVVVCLVFQGSWKRSGSSP